NKLCLTTSHLVTVNSRGWHDPQHYRYNPLQPARHQPKPDYNCSTCNKKGDHWTWQCQKDQCFAAFKQAHDLEKQKGTQQPQRKPNTASGTPTSDKIAHLTEHLRSDPSKTSTFFSMLTQLITPTTAGTPGPSNSSGSSTDNLVMFPGSEFAQE
ncbi:hypothetical protein BJ741DRAFT_601221, partial [Chytriomyces cf. hyalinus JEL632]